MNKTDYTSWGDSELIEKCQNAEVFAREIAEYFEYVESLNVGEGLSENEVYLLEKARKLGGLKIKLSKSKGVYFNGTYHN